MKKLAFGLALLAASSLSACSTAQRFSGVGGITMDGKKAGANPPAPIQSLDEVPKDQSTYHYKAFIYPGLDENFDPHPTLTLRELNQLRKLDWYCADQVNGISGRYREMAKQGMTNAVLQGIFGMLGAMAGFGSLIHPDDYLKYVGVTGFGGGLANGTITFDTALNVAHGYCMTGMVYKADELEGKLSRLFIVPFYVGKADLPPASDKAAPNYPARNRFLAPPPR